jgi:hypothetical protein
VLNKVGRRTLVVLGLIAAVIVTGMIWPGRTGTLIQAGGWIALAGCLILEFRFLWSAEANRDYEGNDRRPY